MNTSSQLFRILTLSAALASVPTVQAGDKTMNGGNAVKVGAKYSLRDLVDNTICNWIRGDMLIQQEPHMNSILSFLRGQSDYYEKQILKQAAQVNFCMTQGDLIQVKTEDTDSLTILDNGKGLQLAIRLNKNVYVDQKIYNQMDAVNRAYLIVHELMHGFLPAKTEQRNMKLRSFISFLRNNEGKNIKPELFYYQIQVNGIQWANGPAQELSVAFKKNNSTKVEELLAKGILFEEYDNSPKLLKAALALGSEMTKVILSAPYEKWWKSTDVEEEYYVHFAQSLQVTGPSTQLGDFCKGRNASYHDRYSIARGLYISHSGFNIVEYPSGRNIEGCVLSVSLMPAAVLSLQNALEKPFITYELFRILTESGKFNIDELKTARELAVLPEIINLLNTAIDQTKSQ